MDNGRAYMDNLPKMMQPRFYHAPRESLGEGQPVRVQALGMAERMPAGHVYHPPPHDLWVADPVPRRGGGRSGGATDRRAGRRRTMIWPPRCERRYGNPERCWMHSWLGSQRRAGTPSVDDQRCADETADGPQSRWSV